MARRSILSTVRDEHAVSAPTEPVTEDTLSTAAGGIRPSRVAKLHIGGYFDPTDPTLIAFQKLKIDLRRSQQDMLLEALRDFVAKYEAAVAFQTSKMQR